MGKKAKSDTSKSSEKNMAVNSSASTNAAAKSDAAKSADSNKLFRYADEIFEYGPTLIK